MNQLLIVAVSALAGGIGIAAATLTYRGCSPPAPPASDAQRQDALERFKIWNDFWKYFLVSFALVLITTLLGNILKERELAMQKSKQESELLLENAKQTSTSLIAENTNLGSFLSNALADNWQKQYAFASYFSHVTRDPEARKRWEDYADFIRAAQQETPKLEAEKAKADTVLAKLNPSDPKYAELEVKRDQVQSQLALNKAILQTPISLSIRGVNLVDGGTLFETGMMIDVDGAPHAYHPDGKSGLDITANAGGPGNWFGVITDNGQPNGNPIVQTSADPAPGFYVSYTSLYDSTKKKNNPLRYVDSETIPYISIPSQLTGIAGIKLGDFATVLNTKNQKLQHAIVADLGPRNRIGDGSIALAKALEVNSNARNGGAIDGIVYKIFPGSGTGWPKTLDEINSEGERLLKAWGGQQRVFSELAGRSDISRAK
jgi:hypothetical protein